MENEYKLIQDELGCPGCYFADKKCLGNSGCCTRLHGPVTNQHGKCTARETERPVIIK